MSNFVKGDKIIVTEPHRGVIYHGYIGTVIEVAGNGGITAHMFNPDGRGKGFCATFTETEITKQRDPGKLYCETCGKEIQEGQFVTQKDDGYHHDKCLGINRVHPSWKQGMR